MATVTAIPTAARRRPPAWPARTTTSRTTAFPLAGAHRTVGCLECHPASAFGTAEAEVRLSGVPSAGRECHSNPHLGRFDRQQPDRPDQPVACGDCHALEGWTPSTFGRDRHIAFPLAGAHAAACGACHFTETVGGNDLVRYRPLPTPCSGCHRPEDSDDR